MGNGYEYKICTQCGTLVQLTKDNKNEKYCAICMGKLSEECNDYGINTEWIKVLAELNRCYQTEHLEKSIKIAKKLLDNLKHLKQSHDSMIKAIAESD